METALALAEGDINRSHKMYEKCLQEVKETGALLKNKSESHQQCMSMVGREKHLMYVIYNKSNHISDKMLVLTNELEYSRNLVGDINSLANGISDTSGDSYIVGRAEGIEYTSRLVKDIFQEMDGTISDINDSLRDIRYTTTLIN